MQGQVLLRLGRAVDLHLVKVQPCPLGKLNTDIPGLLAPYDRAERLVVRVASKDRAVVLVDRPPGLAVVAEHHVQPGRTLADLAAVVDHHAVELENLLEVHLPPGLVVLVGVEAEAAVLDRVAAAGRVVLGQHRAGRGLRRAAGRAEELTLPLLLKPLGKRLGRRRHGQAARRHHRRQPSY